MTLPDEHKPTISIPLDTDEDLEDLDDVLDQFNQPQSPDTFLSAPPPTANVSTTFSRPRTNTRVGAPPISTPGSGPPSNLNSTDEVDEDELSREFSKELAAGMESLMRELNGGTLPGENEAGDAAEDEEAVRRFKATWEAMLVEGLDGSSDSSTTATANGSLRPKPHEFQNTIKQAMDKLRESESNLKADSTSRTGAPDPFDTSPESLETLLASLRDLGLGDGEGPEDEAKLAGFLEGMMGQLMSKDVLYDPLKELLDTFPAYLANPPAPLAEGDRKRYELQLASVHKVLAVFDDPAYSDDNPAMKKTISDLMSEMQTHGAPPPEVMGPLPPGMTLGPDGLPQGDGCVIG